jgi:hypothetical protein
MTRRDWWLVVAAALLTLVAWRAFPRYDWRAYPGSVHAMIRIDRWTSRAETMRPGWHGQWVNETELQRQRTYR